MKDGHFRLFVDGIGGIYEFNGVLRIELLRLRREKEQPTSAKMEMDGELLMPIGTFIETVRRLHEFAEQLERDMKDSSLNSEARMPTARVSKEN